MLIIRLLGAQAVLDGATGRIRTGSSRTLALLGLLIARTGRPQDRAAIAGQFWPESGDGQALTNLRRELHDLRRILGEDDSLEITPGQLCWHDRRRHDIDLSTFLRESAATEGAPDEVAVTHGSVALEHYGGPLLPGLDDEWLDALRSTSSSSDVRRCASGCIWRHARLGRTDVAMAALDKLLTVDPFNEPAHRALIQLHADSGDRAGAISIYHRLATLLERELGVAPASLTTALVTELLGDTGRPGTLGVTRRRWPSRSRIWSAVLQSSSTLLACWHDASAGYARVLVVYGGAGVGKSSLVSELVRRARGEGTVVGRSICFDTGGRLSLAPVADWLRHSELIAARGRLSPEWIAEVDRLVPAETQSAAQPQRSPRAHRPRTSGSATGSSRPSRAPAGAGAPLLLVLDNLQWSDPDTLSFVRFLPQLRPTARLLVATTVRSGAPDLDPAIEAWLGQMRDEGLLTEISLGPLAIAETTALATALTGRRFDAAEAELLYDATGGFPLYVVEAARSAAPGPSRRVVGPIARLDGDPPEADPAAQSRGAGGGRSCSGSGARLQHSAAEPRPATSTSRVSLSPSTSCGGVGSFGKSGIATTSRTICCGARPTTLSPQHGVGCCTAGSPRHSNCSGPGTTDTVAAQIAEQYRLAGNPRACVAVLRARGRSGGRDVRSRRRGHLLDRRAASSRLHAPHGRDRDQRELTLLEMSIPPLNALHGYSSPLVRETCERSVNLADELDLTARMVTAMVGLWSSRFVEGRLQESFELARKRP